MSTTEQQVIEQWATLVAQSEQHEAAMHALQQAADDFLTDYATQLANRHGVEVGQIYRNTTTGDFWLVRGFQAGVFYLDNDDPQSFLRVRVQVQKVKKWKPLRRFEQPLLQQFVDSETLPKVNPKLHRYEFTQQEMVL